MTAAGMGSICGHCIYIVTLCIVPLYGVLLYSRPLVSLRVLE